MHTAWSSASLSKDYTLPSADVTTLTKQQDDPLKERRTHVRSIFGRSRVREMYFEENIYIGHARTEFFHELETSHTARHCTKCHIFRRRKEEFGNMCYVSLTNLLSVLSDRIVGHDFLSRESKDSSR